MKFLDRVIGDLGLGVGIGFLGRVGVGLEFIEVMVVVRVIMVMG